MPKSDNKLSGARNLGLLGAASQAQNDKLTLSDAESLYRFNVDQGSTFDLLLSGLAKRSNADVELYLLKRPIEQMPRKVGKTDFARLSSAMRQANFQWMATSVTGSNRQKRIAMSRLEAGQYVVRVKQRSGKKSRYALQLAAPPIETIAPTVKRGDRISFRDNGFTFPVTYSDNVAVNVSSIDDYDIRVTGPNGYSQLASVVNIDSNSNGASRTVTYRATVPGGTLDSADNGRYVISLEGNQVSDTNGNFAAAVSIAEFNVNRPADPNAPVDPETPLELESELFEFSGYPDGIVSEFKINFAKNKDEDLRADYGLFRGVVSDGITYAGGGSEELPWSDRSTKNFQSNSIILLKSANGGPDYYPGDLIAFRQPNGETEYRAVLFSTVNADGNGYALCIGFNVKAGVADPSSLSSLKIAMTTAGSVEMRRYHGTSQEFQQGSRKLEDVAMQKFASELSVRYTLKPDQKDYVLTFSFDPSGYNDGRQRSYDVIGNARDNTITGDDRRNVLSGLQGDDQLFGKGEYDRLYGGEGNDTISGGDGNDFLYGEAGNDRLEGGEEADSLDGGTGDDRLEGGEGDDTLDGGTGDDRLEGGEGDDTLTGFGLLGIDASESDILIGGGGADKFVLAGRNSQFQDEPFYVESREGYATIQDWKTGDDQISIRGLNKDLFSFVYKNVIGDSRTDIEIYYSSGSPKDRIAIIQDTTAIFNPADDFTF